MGARVRVGDSEFELSFDLGPDEPLPPGVEWVEEPVDEEETWPAGTPAALVAYAKELAISSDQVAHWVSFFTGHPQGQLAWEEIGRLWKSTGRRRRSQK